MAQKVYSRLSIEEREILYKKLAEGTKQSQIAKELDRHPSAISREIRRNGMNRETYRPTKAEQNSKQQSLKRRKKLKLVQNPDLTAFVEDKLMEKWSPEQISWVLKKVSSNSSTQISHETIYRHIYSIENKEHKSSLINCLRRSRKRRRPRKRGSKKRTTIRNLVSIHARPRAVENREEVGHWEGDLVIGKDHQSAIGTLVERTTRRTIIVSFSQNHSTKEVVLGFAAALGILPTHMKKSLTYDRGSEMAGHTKLTEITGIPVFFADPYSPWQRGTNENTNGLIRTYFPKGTDFNEIDDERILTVQNALNERPRKCLDYGTPNKFFDWFSENPESDLNHFYWTHFQEVT